MSRARYLLLTMAITAVWLTGCASAPEEEEGPQEPTLGSLQSRSQVPVAAPLPKVSSDEAKRSYQRLLEQQAQGKVKAEALRRLADLTVRQAEAKLLAEADGDLGQLSAGERDASFEKAITLYRQLLREFPDYHDRAGVYYQLAKAHDLQAERDASLDALAMLAKEFPNDSQAAEAQFRRGEAAFVARNWGEAEQAYSAVIAVTAKNPFSDQAQYKRGWTRYKRNDFDLALEDFIPLVERLRKLDDRDVQVRELRGDTLRVTALAFSNLEGPAAVRDWFAKAGEKNYEPDIYRALADLYVSQERFKDAADTYNMFVTQRPLHDEAPAFSTAIIETYQRGGFPTLVLPAKEDFAERYGRRSEFWARARGPAREQLLPQLKTHIRDVATHYHALAQKSRLPTDYRTSARWYREYLDTFPNEPEAPELHFLLAEALYDANAPAEAGPEFEKVAYDYPLHGKSEPAGYAALVSYSHLLRVAAAQDEKGKPLKGAQPNPEGIKRWQLEGVRAGLRYANSFASNSKAPTVLSQVINWQLAAADLSGAVASARQLLIMDQATPAQQREARTVIANGEFDLGRFVAAEQGYTDALRTPGFDAKTIAQFHERRSQAIYKQGEAAVKSAAQQTDPALQRADKLTAVEHFLRLGQIEPQSPVRANAEYDAAALLLDIADWGRAIAVLEQFRQQFGKHPLAAGVGEKLAYAYEQAQNWQAAAVEYVSLSKTSSDPQFAREALLRAAEFQSKSGNTAAAMTIWQDYLKRFPQPFADAQEARAKLIGYFDSTGNAGERDRIRRDLVKAHDADNASKTPRQLYLVAQAAFALAEPGYEAYQKLTLKLPLDKSLKAKRQAMQTALKTYEQINAYAVAEYTTAATYRIGEIYRSLAQSLMSSERPKGLDADALDEYNVLLEEQALPFEDKAMEFFSANLSYVRDGVYNEWTERSLTALRDMQPARYGKTEYVETQY